MKTLNIYDFKIQGKSHYYLKSDELIYQSCLKLK